MPAFGHNRFSIPFVLNVLERQILISGGTGEEDDPPVYNVIGFRLSDRILSAIDRLYGDLARFANATYPGLNRWCWVYPFIGGQDWTHAMNMVDLDGAFTKYLLTYTGTITHNANGITLASGATCDTHADCGYTLDQDGLDNWVHKTWGIYSRSDTAPASGDMGAYRRETNGYDYYQTLYCRYSDGSAYFDNVRAVLVSSGAQAGNRIGPVAVPTSKGLTVDSRLMTSADHRGYKNGVQIGATDTSAASGLGVGSVRGSTMKITGPRNFAFCFSTKRGGSLNVPENATLYAIVQRFQVAMGRHVV
jgi:hypothetical protein